MLRRSRRTGTTAAVVAVIAVIALAAPVSAAHGTLRHFGGVSSDAAQPAASLVRAADGYFYGTSVRGGRHDAGTVFRMDASGAVSVLHSFSADPDSALGHGPRARLIEASDGFLYGTTAAGGDGFYGSESNCPSHPGTCGSVFRIDRSGAITLLHRFSGAPADGAWAAAGVVQGADGALYGTTRVGGLHDRGTVYRVTRSGAFALLHSFSGAASGGVDGMWPVASLVQGPDGYLYGTTSRHYFGSTGFGTVFTVNPSGTFRTIHVFKPASGLPDGRHPVARLLLARDGFFYGTTAEGGRDGFGTIFRINASGSDYRLVHHFDMYGTTGAYPGAGLSQDGEGFFYGAASEAGLPTGNANTEGVIYKMHPTTFKVGVLRTFFESADGLSAPQGRNPGSELLLSAGTLYGTTALGGSSNLGVAYRYRLAAAPVLARLAFYPDRLWGGDPSSSTSTGTVILDGLARTGGTVVTLRSSHPDVVAVPSSVTVPYGWSTASFRVTASEVDAETSVTIYATYGGRTRQATLTVYPLN